MIKFGSDSVVLRFQKNLTDYNMKSEKKEAIVQNKKEILDLNKSQIRIGIDSKGKTFGDYVSDWYADMKAELSSYFAKKPTPDLYLTGKLQKEMDLNVSGTKVNIFSNDPEADEKTAGRFSNAFGINKNIQPLTEKRTTETFFENTHNILFK